MVCLRFIYCDVLHNDNSTLLFHPHPLFPLFVSVYCVCIVFVLCSCLVLVTMMSGRMLQDVVKEGLGWMQLDDGDWGPDESDYFDHYFDQDSHLNYHSYPSPSPAAAAAAAASTLDIGNNVLCDKRERRNDNDHNTSSDERLASFHRNEHHSDESHSVTLCGDDDSSAPHGKSGREKKVCGEVSEISEVSSAAASPLTSSAHNNNGGEREREREREEEEDEKSNKGPRQKGGTPRRHHHHPLFEITT